MTQKPPRPAWRDICWLGGARDFFPDQISGYSAWPYNCGRGSVPNGFGWMRNGEILFICRESAEVFHHPTWQFVKSMFRRKRL
jgi:hypothetical protein